MSVHVNVSAIALPRLEATWRCASPSRRAAGWAAANATANVAFIVYSVWTAPHRDAGAPYNLSILVVAWAELVGVAACVAVAILAAAVPRLRGTGSTALARAGTLSLLNLLPSHTALLRGRVAAAEHAALHIGTVTVALLLSTVALLLKLRSVQRVVAENAEGWSYSEWSAALGFAVQVMGLVDDRARAVAVDTAEPFLLHIHQSAPTLFAEALSKLQASEGVVSGALRHLTHTPETHTALLLAVMDDLQQGVAHGPAAAAAGPAAAEQGVPHGPAAEEVAERM